MDLQRSLCTVFLLVCASPVVAQTASDTHAELDIAANYEQIVADYQRIAATGDPAAIESAGRLVTFAYRNLIDRAGADHELDAAELYALGACHEGLGQTEQAKAFFTRSLEQQARPRTHLALVRVHLVDDLEVADRHFAAAATLDPEYPQLRDFRLALATAHAARHNWQAAATYLERYAEFTYSLTESQPGNSAVTAAHEAVSERLATLRRFAELMGEVPPPLAVQHWVQGDEVQLADLRGKPVLIDFCAMWAEPSRARIERLKKLQARYGELGLEVIGVTLAYGHGYDPDTDAVDLTAERAPADERADLLRFAQTRDIPYRLAMIEQTTVDAYSVRSLPHTLLLDQQGRVKMILQASSREQEAELEATLREMLAES